MSKTLVPINKIIPDENQPRKYFDVTKIASLKKSIKTHGIVNPITVEKNKDNYLIIDGERRFRAAKELRLKEIPINLIDSKDPINRKIEQFHIQEMHEGWTPMEKAQVILDLSNEIKKPFAEICDILNIRPSMGRVYYAMSKLLEKNAFAENNISSSFAEPLISLGEYVKNIKHKDLDETFTSTEIRKLQKRVIADIVEDKITKPHDLTKLKDTFKMQPKSIDKYLSGEDGEHLYVKSKAKSAYHVRNAVNSASYICTHISGFMMHPDVKLSNTDVGQLTSGLRAIEKLLTFAGKN